MGSQQGKKFGIDGANSGKQLLTCTPSATIGEPDKYGKRRGTTNLDPTARKKKKERWRKHREIYGDKKKKRREAGMEN